MKNLIIFTCFFFIALFSCDTTTGPEKPDVHYIVFKTSNIESIDREPHRRYIATVDDIIESTSNIVFDFLFIHDPGYNMPYENGWSGIDTESRTIRVDNAYGSWTVAEVK